MQRLACLIVFLLLPVMGQAAPVHGIDNTYLEAPDGLAIFKAQDLAPTLDEMSEGLTGYLDWERRDGFDKSGPRVGWLDVQHRMALASELGYDLGFIGVDGLRRAAGIVLQGLTTTQVFGTEMSEASDRFGALFDLNAIAASERFLSEIVRGSQLSFLGPQSSSAEVAPVPGPAGLPLMLGAVGILAIRRARQIGK